MIAEVGKRYIFRVKVKYVAEVGMFKEGVLELKPKNLDSKKVSFYLKPSHASDQRHLVTGV